MTDLTDVRSVGCLLKIFLISDFQLFLSGLAAMFQARSDRYTVCGVAHCLESEIPPWSTEVPDLVIIDLEMDIEGVLALLKTRKGGTAEKVLLIHRQGALEHQEEVLLSGAHGLIDKYCPESDFIKAVERIVSGGIWFDHASTIQLWKRLVGSKSNQEEILDKLTVRERKIAFAVLNSGGKAGKVVASKLNISESTLRTHLTSIYKKFEVSRAELIAFGFKNKLIKNTLP